MRLLDEDGGQAFAKREGGNGEQLALFVKIGKLDQVLRWLYRATANSRIWAKHLDRLLVKHLEEPVQVGFDGDGLAKTGEDLQL